MTRMDSPVSRRTLLRQAAATAAGLVPAGTAAYLVIAPDGSSTLRGSVTPAPQPPRSRSVAADRD
jgi:cell division protein FtsI (penicillin-binding protein 3)